MKQNQEQSLHTLYEIQIYCVYIYICNIVIVYSWINTQYIAAIARLEQKSFFKGSSAEKYCQPLSAPRFKASPVAGFHIIHRALSGCSTNCALEAQEWSSENGKLMMCFSLQSNGSDDMIQHVLCDILRSQIVVQLHWFAKTWQQILYRNSCWGRWCGTQDHVNLKFIGTLPETPDLFGDCWTSFMILWDDHGVTTTTVNLMDWSMSRETVTQLYEAFTQYRNQIRISKQCCMTRETTKMRPYPPTQQPA